MRLYGTIPVAPKLSDKEVQVGDYYLLPKGTTVIVNLFAILHNEKYFEKPFEFIPERWIDSNKYHPYSWIPFR